MWSVGAVIPSFFPSMTSLCWETLEGDTEGTLIPSLVSRTGVETAYSYCHSHLAQVQAVRQHDPQSKPTPLARPQRAAHYDQP